MDEHSAWYVGGATNSSPNLLPPNGLAYQALSGAPNQPSEAAVGTLTSPAYTVNLTTLSFLAAGFCGSGSVGNGQSYYQILNQSQQVIDTIGTAQSDSWIPETVNLLGLGLAPGQTFYVRAVDGDNVYVGPNGPNYAWMGIDQVQETGAAVTVTVSGLSLTGAQAADYVLPTPQFTTTANIFAAGTTTTVNTTTTVSTSSQMSVYGTPVTLTATVAAASGTAAPSLGSVQFSVTNNGTTTPLGAAVSSDTTSGTNAVFTLVTGGTAFQAGNTNAISVVYAPGSGFTGSTSTNLVAETVAPKTLTAAIVGNPTKFYDGTGAAVLTPANFSLSGLVGTDSFTVNQTVGAYNSKDVTATTVSANLAAANFTPGAGTSASNYVLPLSGSSSTNVTATVPGTQTYYDGSNGTLAMPVALPQGVTQAVLATGEALSGFGSTLISPDGLDSSGNISAFQFTNNHFSGTYQGTKIGGTTGIDPALFGVFFSPSREGTPADSVNYRTDSGISPDPRTLATYAPALNQPFFIGDGYNLTTGVDLDLSDSLILAGNQQTFTYPAGYASRIAPGHRRGQQSV